MSNIRIEIVATEAAADALCTEWAKPFHQMTVTKERIATAHWRNTLRSPAVEDTAFDAADFEAWMVIGRR